MKVVINKCYGGFGLSHKAVMRYGELSGTPLFAFVERGISRLDKFRPYKEGEKAFLIHYATKPLRDDGTYDENSYWYDRSLERTDSILVQVVEELGDSANGDCAKLKIVEIPDGTKYEIDDYDGMESIHEVHQSWG